MPENNEVINRTQSIEMGMIPGIYVYKLCTNNCGSGRYIPRRRYTAARLCKVCLLGQMKQSKVGKANE